MPLPTAEELAERKAAATLWLSKNIATAIVIPLGVWKDLFPEGGGQIEVAALIEPLIPGEQVEGVDRSTDAIYVRMKV